MRDHAATLPFSTMYRNRGITTKERASVYRGTAGLERGKTVDADTALWVEHGVFPTNAYSRSFIRHIETLLLTDLAVQVRVRSTGQRWSTALDVVALTGPRTPRVIECKTTSMSAAEFRGAFDAVDPVFPTMKSLHMTATVGNTCRQRYMDQLCNGMNMYALTMKWSVGAPCYGSLVVVCRDAIVMYDRDFMYAPGTGINTVVRSVRAPKKKPVKRGKRAAATAPVPSTPGSKKRRRGRAAAPPRP